MRAAVAAVIVLALLVAGLALVAVEEPASAHDEQPAIQTQTGTSTPYGQDVATEVPCPSAGDGIELTGCPDAARLWVPSVSGTDLRRLERLPPQG